MPFSDLKITQIKLDNKNRVWTSGQDLSYYDGSQWNYVNYQNSALPSNDPYYLDTRCLSIDLDQKKWVGCANGPCISDVAVAVLSGLDNDQSKSWTFTDLGFTGGYYQCPVIEASPYGSEVLAFFNDLNDGIGVTGTTGYFGVTGGTLLIYNQISNQWSNPIPDYTLPRVYSITPRGIGGDSYEYWLGTENGIWIIESAKYEAKSLLSGEIYVPNIKILNTSNSGLPGDSIRAIEFDENDNAWIGTDNGICYYDHDKFSTWTSSDFPALASDLITKIAVRPNGHIFFSAGDGELKEGTGLYHFNGANITRYSTGTGDLPNNNVISIEVIHVNTQNGDLRNYSNDLWVSCYNEAVQFSYVIPHVRSTSDFTGATGWDFVNYTNPGDLNLPKADKFTFDYPSWSGEDFSRLESMHPGTDPRLLFVNTDLQDIISGRAGQESYYDSGNIPLYSEEQLAKTFDPSSFVQTATGGTSYVTSSSVIGDSIVIGGYTDSALVNFGLKNSGESVILNNPNPTNLGSPVPSGSNLNVGFLAYYSLAGQIKSVIPFRGKSTKVHSIRTSPDESSLYVLGSFDGYIEIGQFVFNNLYPNAASQTITGITGPTGAPIGFSSLNFPGITGPVFAYPWILNGATASTAGPFIPDPSLISTSAEALFIAEIDANLGSEVSYGGINFGITGDLQRSYNLKNFRYFPVSSSDLDPLGATGFVGLFDTRYADLNVSKNRVDIATGISGGFSTLKQSWSYTNDIPNSPNLIFSSYSAGYKKSGVHIELDRDLNLYSSQASSATGDSFFSKIVSDDSSNSVLITGSSDSNLSFGATGSTAYTGIPTDPFFLVYNRAGSVAKEGIQFISRGFSDEQGFSLFPFSKNGLYSISSIVAPQPSIWLNGSSYGITGGTAIFVQNFTPNGIPDTTFTHPISSSYGAIQDSLINHRGEFILSSREYGATGTTGSIFLRKISRSGTLQDAIQISTPDQLMESISLSQSASSDLFLSLSHLGSTGPSSYSYPSTSIVQTSTIKIPQHQPKTGVNFGNISSKYGEGAWNWADVHVNGRTFIVPLLSTVFLTNYTSDIYGKNLNAWKISDAQTGEIILDVRGVPYFIYTFSTPGYYTLENTVEDANGNVYAATRTSFVEVKDHTQKKDNDPDPFIVNSSDYGYIMQKQGRETFITNLSKELLAEQLQNLKDNAQAFLGSPLIIKDDPDATFRSE